MDESRMNQMLLNDFDSVWDNFRNSDEDTKAQLCRQYALLKWDRFDQSRDPHDLEEAIEKARWAVAGSDETWSLNLGSFLWKRYERTKSLNDANEAVTLTRQALSHIDPDDPAHIGAMSNLKAFLTTRYEHLSNVEDLEEAIEITKRSLEIPDLGDPEFAQKLPSFTKDLNSFGNLLRSRYERLGQLSDINDAIELGRDVLSFTPRTDPERPSYLNDLALALNGKSEASEDVAMLEEAIRLGSDAVLLTRRNDVDMPVWLANLGMYLSRLYQQTKEIETLEEAIRVSRRGISILPRGHPNLAGLSNNLGMALQDRYDKIKKAEDLNEAIRVTRQAINLSATGSPHHITFLSNLGTLLTKQYDQTNLATDLAEAIQIQRTVVDSTPQNHPKLANRMNSLASSLDQRFNSEENMNDLQEAVRLSRDAYNIIPEGSKDFQHSSSTLATWLGRLHERTGRIEYLKEAIRLVRRAITLVSPDSPEYTEMIHNLGCFLRSEYEQTGDRHCLEEDIKLTTEAVKLTSEGGPHRAILLNSMALALSNEFEITGYMDILNQVIDLLRKAVDLGSVDRPNFIQYLGFLNNLANKLSWRFGNTGEVRDLDESIRIARRIISLSSPDQTGYAGHLNNLGNFLRHRFEYSGDLEDIKEAIKLARQAIDSTGADDPNLPTMYDNLAIQLFRLYENTGAMEFLDEAIQSMRHTIGEHIAKTSLPDFLRSMVTYLDRRYLRTRQPSDIEEAIQMARNVVAMTPEDHPGLVERLATLGDVLGHRYEHRGNEGDLKEAIDLLHKAVAIAPSTHPKRIWVLTTLGVQLIRGYDRTMNNDYLDEALKVAQQTVDITPPTDPDLAAHLYNLASNYSRRHQCAGAEDDLKQAVKAALQSWNCSNSPPFVRLKSSALAVHSLRLSQRLEEAYTLTNQVLDFIPHVHKRSLNITDQQYIATHFSGFATDACSLALEVGRSAEIALEELERGRGVILGFLMDDRSDISLLRAEHPELCAQYEALRLKLSNPSQKGANEKSSNYLAAEKRTEIGNELETCVQYIQELPGFQNFFKGLTPKDIQNCAMEGNIIIINITKIRSDALIVTPNAIEAVPLPDLKPRDAFDWVRKDLTTTTMQDRGRKNKEYRDFLAWLWRMCVKPVLDHLGYSVQSSTDNLPRVWWIGTGFASSFPFHAANHGFNPSEHSRFRVISSYTTTIKALRHSRDRFQTPTLPPGDQPRCLIIAMPETPGASDLPGTRTEISAIESSIHNSTIVEILECPDIATSLGQLEHCNIAHLACHGISNYADPSQSGLILRAPNLATGKPTAEILSVQRIFQAHFAKPQIAYLSACSTAQNESARLEDEVLHAVSGFQVAGFKHVLGCMWPSDDSICVKVARSFYTSIGRRYEVWKDDRAVALAMHNAVLAIQEDVEYRKRPLLWAQYVHFGA